MASFKVKIAQGALRAVELEVSPGVSPGVSPDRLGFFEEMDMRSALAENADSVLGKEFALFSSMHIYLETQLGKSPFYVEAGLFGAVNLTDLARINQRFAPLVKADIDISIENDEDPFSGGHLLEQGELLPWLEEVKAQAHAQAHANDHANTRAAGVPPATQPAVATGNDTRGTHETHGDTTSRASRPRYFRPFMNFHVDGHGEEGRRGGAQGRSALAKKHLGLMKEAASLISQLYGRALLKIEADAVSLSKNRSPKARKN